MDIPLYTGIPQFIQQFCSWKMQTLMRFKNGCYGRLTVMEIVNVIFYGY
jgi:hypothetical protein